MRSEGNPFYISHGGWLIFGSAAAADRFFTPITPNFTAG